MLSIFTYKNNRAAIKALMLAFVCIFTQSGLSGQNCDPFKSLQQGGYYRFSTTLGLHYVAEEYANTLLRLTDANDPDFEKTLQIAADCFVSSNELGNGNDNDNTLIFLIYSSRTIAAVVKPASDINSIDYFQDLTAQEMGPEAWTSALKILTSDEKKELFNILLSEFRQSHSPEFIREEQEYIKRLLSKNGATTVKPVVMITSKPDSLVKRSPVTLQFIAYPASEFKSISVKVNGNGLQGSSEKNEGQWNYIYKVPLEKGDNTIAIHYTTKDGQDSTRLIQVHYRPDNFMDRHDRAILIAIDDYSKANGVDNLKKPIQDAEKFAKALVKFGFDTIILRNPTQLELQSFIRQYQDTVFDPYDQLLVFYAGHGIIDKKGNGYILPSDGNDSILDKNIEFSWLRNRLNEIDCEHILFICDACHSGAFGDTTTWRAAARVAGPQATIMKYRTRLFMGSCMAKDETPDNSPFMDVLLNQLKSNNDIDYYQIQGALNTSYQNNKAEKLKECSFGTFGHHNKNADFFFNRR